MYEENQNSAWLLPNRIYEGGLYGAIPIALGNVETGKFLKQLGIGAILSSTTSKELISFFKRLTPAYYQSLCHAINRLPKETWAYTEQDCKDFVHRLESLTDNPHG
jgi:succinoglycan biosynthesis protein ExoL